MNLHGTVPFRSHPLQNANHKHQEIFRSKDFSKDNYNNASLSTVGFLFENDPYEANAFEVLRSKWIEDSKKLYGDFIPAHGNQALRKVNR